MSSTGTLVKRPISAHPVDNQRLVWARELLPGFAAGAFEAAQFFLVVADPGGDGFEAAAQLVDLDGQAGQGAGVLAPGAVFLDDSAQVGPPVGGGPADLPPFSYFSERDAPPRGRAPRPP